MQQTGHLRFLSQYEGEKPSHQALQKSPQVEDGLEAAKHQLVARRTTEAVQNRVNEIK